jgi:hypothetical protein
MKVATYLESWAVPFSVSSNNDISNLDANVDTVYLSFASPDNTYKKGDFTFSNTGLNFSMDFKTVVESIRILKKRKVTVMLAVGGGSYWSEPKPFNPLGCIDLMNDLGCDGIDIDWEVGIADDRAPANAIKALAPLLGGFNCLSFTCFSTGAYPPSLNDKYKGMNIRAIKECINDIDNINIMASFRTNH